MRLPTEAARAAILHGHLAGLPEPFDRVELDRVVAATEDFSGADLKRLVEDARALYAYNRVRRVPLLPITDYLLRAVETVHANKQRYAEAEARARSQRIAGRGAMFFPTDAFSPDPDMTPDD